MLFHILVSVYLIFTTGTAVGIDTVTGSDQVGRNSSAEDFTIGDALNENETIDIVINTSPLTATLQTVNDMSETGEEPCHNHRGYKSIELCISDCTLKQLEHSNGIYKQVPFFYKALYVKSSEFTIENGNLHISSWNITNANDSFVWYDNDTAIVCIPIYDEMKTCDEARIKEPRVEFRDNGHTMWILLIEHEFKWNEYFYYKGSMIFCSPEILNVYENIVQWHLVAALISTIALILGLLLSFVIPILGKNPILMCHMIMLALSYITICCRILIKDNSEAYCITINAFLHFFLLSSFLWMNIHAFDLYLAIKSIRTSKKLSKRRFLVYSCISWGLPFILMMMASIAEIYEFKPMMPGFKLHCSFEYGGSLSFAYYYGWSSVTFLMNIVLFILIAWTFRRISKEVASANQKTQKKLLIVTVKLVVVMGFFYIFEILIWAQIGGTVIMSWLDILFSFQGLFIFLIYVCRIKVLKKVLTKLKALFKRKDEPDGRNATSMSASAATLSSVSESSSADTSFTTVN